MIKKSLNSEGNITDIKGTLIKKAKTIRIRWRKIVKSEKFNYYIFQGDSELSPKKFLYFVKPGSWWKEMLEEINELETEIREAGFVGRKKPRKLWLPVMIEDAVEITVKIYQAKSVRSVSIDTAINFKSEARSGHAVRLRLTKAKASQYGIDSPTGRNYKLRVKNSSSLKISYFKFTNWAVCLGSKNKPIEVYEENPEYTAKSDSKIPLCRSKDNKRFLFEVE